MAVFRKDPCGFTCLIMTYAAVIYADYVVVRWLVMHTWLHDTLWGAFNVLVFNVIVFLLFMSHARAVFSDPGIVPLPQHRIDFSDLHSSGSGSKSKLTGSQTSLDPPEEDWTICTRCEMYRPPRAHHCRICGRCILRMDHHCPWINNCVGQWNQKYFLQFLFYVGLLAAYSLFLVAVSWYFSPAVPNVNQSVMSDSHRDAMRIKQSRILHSVLLVLESVLFGLFVIAIGCDQFEAIFTDETLVEQAKKQGPYRPRKAKWALLAEVCGRDHPFFWIFPCHNVNNTFEPVGNNYTV